ncbi:MAG: hypothetical protein DLM65_02990 [Candidatus Aeolococcus gillhamiae]|uniref:Uncharacterized protein n=1 Tax=Candidatus Aeolococcus gillhamiae TaxID=3127015 RepID=A0A2W5ZIM1_9BACT|nr:MAG: hypothetical protein DLM65_02990 [Candidatus Dormibacter sp. RRmetagenome_bin12]
MVGVNTNAHQADNIVPQLAAAPVTAGTSDPVTVSPDSARGLAKTTSVGLVFTAPGSIDPIAIALSALPGLLTADAVTAEAVAKCVNNQPVFETGYQIAGLGGLVGGVLSGPVQTLLNTLLGLIGPGAVLSSVISITPGAVTPLSDGVAIDGLQVRLPLLNETIVVSHAEAHMPPGCRVVAAAAPVAPVAPVAARLATTGSDVPFLPLGMAMVAVAVLGGTVVRRSRRQATPIQ